MSFHRPIEGALQQTLRLFGKPMTIAAFSNEMAVLNARSPEYFQTMLPEFLAERPQTYFRTPEGRGGSSNGCWTPRDWMKTSC